MMVSFMASGDLWSIVHRQKSGMRVSIPIGQAQWSGSIQMPKILNSAVMLGACLACLLVFAGSLHAAPGRELRARAVEIAYRLDVELGEIDAAQRNILIWRLIDAHSSGDLAAGASLSDDWLIWQQRLEQMETSLALTRLPVWFQPYRPDAVTAVLAFHDAGSKDLNWNTGLQVYRDASASMQVVLGPDAPQVARALTPGLLAFSRSYGADIWAWLLVELERNPELVPLVDPLVRSWLALPLDSSLAEWQALEDDAAGDLRRLAEQRELGDPLTALRSTVAMLQSESLLIDIRDRRRMARFRYAAFLHNDSLDDLDRALIALAEGVLHLEQGGHVEFLQTLSALAHVNLSRLDLLESRQRTQAALDSLAELDSWLLGQLGQVDGRLLTVYQQLRRLLRDWAGRSPDTSTGLRSELLHDLTTLGAVLDLAAGDADGYMAQPFRMPFENRLLVCFGLGGDERVHPPEPISREDFEQCMDEFRRWANESAVELELAGDRQGPFEAQHRSRELELDAFQRINYWDGYLGRENEEGCQRDAAEPLANPLEWALGARAFVQFARRWPAYFEAAELENQVAQMIDQGRNLLAYWEFFDVCRSQGVNPVLVQLARYHSELDRFTEAVEAATARFREMRVKNGSDVLLDQDAWQTTRFQPVERKVGPCGGVAYCDMSDELPSSRALFDLFPGPLLVADQVGLGEVSMCYQDVQWLDRRAELPAVRNQAMANYFGRMSFDLVGRYQGMDQPVFRMRLTSSEQHEYLFGANSPEVLDDACPRHLVDTKVTSMLPDRTLQLVPRRLTYLTADRMHPSKLFDRHWANGDEWRDWFVTGRGVERIEANGPEDIVPLVNDRLQALFNEWNQTVYAQILIEDPLVTEDTTVQLQEVMRALDDAKRTTQVIARIVLPETIKQDPALRASLFGEAALFDQRIALQMQRDAVPVNMIGSMARSHYRDSLALWQRLSNYRSLPRSQPEELVVVTMAEMVSLLER
jgi:hypothetical protein